MVKDKTLRGLATRFGGPRGNMPGRKESKDKLSQAFLRDLHAIWLKQGPDLLKRMAAEKNDTGNQTLAKIIASIEPKELEIVRPLDGLDDTKLAKAVDVLTEMLRGQMPTPPDGEEWTEPLYDYKAKPTVN